MVEFMTRLDYLVAGRTVTIFTDHANLVHMYNPYGSNPGIAQHTASKLTLSAFCYVIEHIPSEKNVWADMLTRWVVQPRNKVKPSGSIKALMSAPINNGLDHKFDWPVRDDIVASQE